MSVGLSLKKGVIENAALSCTVMRCVIATERDRSYEVRSRLHTNWRTQGRQHQSSHTSENKHGLRSLLYRSQLHFAEVDITRTSDVRWYPAFNSEPFPRDNPPPNGPYVTAHQLEVESIHRNEPTNPNIRQCFGSTNRRRGGATGVSVDYSESNPLDFSLLPWLFRP
ncbi:MAG TPA: hypothetical protein DDX19_25770 [Rhodopirellula baltica]|nr:hypothetical protein [Rhodopirellula baltica]